ncbi:MAG TPA: HNH endonuclease signature motif containing protein, partial [Acidimicrobiales bacterium]|nr:HNH endonuclease signature motif containing protein [Acidimicrobiales bacterium]
TKNGCRQRTDPDVDPDAYDAEVGDIEDGDLEEVTDGFSLIDRPPTCSVNVRVDLAALLRGKTQPGEICEIDGQGPIPPKMARDMANDSFLRFIFCESGDIRSVFHFGRTINKALRTALVHRDRNCVVPGCRVSSRLEIDHVLPVTEGGPTTLDNLALLCHHHHFLKTFEGWTLEMVDGTNSEHPKWRFEPLPPFGEEPTPDPDVPRAGQKWRRPRGRGDHEIDRRQPTVSRNPGSGQLFKPG